MEVTESYFVNAKYRHKIDNVFPSTKFTINVKSLSGYIEKTCYIVVEKIVTYNLLQVRVTETIDEAKMYVSTVDSNSFERLKHDQSLHVTFSGFVENLVLLLNSCRNNLMQINLSNLENDGRLQFFETKSFRNLVHLSLPVKQAPLSSILYHISGDLQMLEKQQNNYVTNIQQLHRELAQKDEQINHFKVEIVKLSSKLDEQQNIVLCRTNEEIIKLQQNIKEATDTKDKNDTQYRKKLSDMKQKLEGVERENGMLRDEKISEIRKYEKLREEFCAYKSNTNIMKAANDQLLIEISSLRNIERKNEMHLNDLRKENEIVRHLLKKEEQLKSDVAAQLEAEKNICQKKRNGLQLLTEKIAKANETILQKSKEIDDLRKNIEWRTDVALQQEIVIQEKEKYIAMQMARLENFETKLKKKEYPEHHVQLELMKKTADSFESKYRKKIAELSRQIVILDKTGITSNEE